MARVDDLRTICDLTGICLTEKQLTGIAATTPPVADVERIANELNSLDAPTAKDLKRLLLKQKRIPSEKAYCGHCHEGFVPILNRYLFNLSGRPEYTTSVGLPRSFVSCPNCGKERDALQKVLVTMDEVERGWSWVLLYEFARYRNMDPAHFTEWDATSAYPHLDIEPVLNTTQGQVLEWIFRPYVAPLTRYPHTSTAKPIENFSKPADLLAQFMKAGEKRLGITEKGEINAQ